MDMQQYLADLSLKTMSRVHRAIVHLSGGQLLGSAFGMPVVDGDRVVLVASKGGDDRDPDWYRNLMAHPEVELTMGGRRRPMLARQASAAEKAELWPRVVAAYQGYGGYQRRTERDIPLVILEPR